MSNNNKFLNRFLIYQKERFPVVVLLFTTLSVVLSSYAISSTFVVVTNAPLKIFLGLMSAIICLFHTRVIDEHRDFNHDSQHHKYRPVQRGLISRKELKYIDYIGLFIFMCVALFYGTYTLIFGLIILIFSFIASKDFFLGEIIRKRFLIYNAVNLIQTILLQAFVYSIFINWWYNFSILWLHLVFVLSNSILIEFIRKIKIKEEESTGQDTYSWHFGFKKSLWIHKLLIVINYSLFLLTMRLQHILTILTFTISIIFVILLLGSALRHLRRKDKSSESVLLLNTLILYIGLHLMVYFSIKF